MLDDTDREDESDREAALEALEESKKSQTGATSIIASAMYEIRMIKLHRERNHFSDKFRNAIRGIQ